MNITLRPYYGNNPFADHPPLRTIWQGPLQRLAEEGTYEVLTEENNYYTSEGFQRPEDVFLICAEGRVIGLTGFFFEENPDDIFLRWTGVIPEYRRQGVSSQALILVLQEARRQFPNIKTVIENVPEHQSDIIAFFAARGFQPTGPMEYDEWSDMVWQQHTADIATVLNHSAGGYEPVMGNVSPFP